jgi:hypothetical protein
MARTHAIYHYTYFCARDPEEILLTSGSSRAALEWADRRQIRTNKTRSNRPPLVSAVFCTACIRKSTDRHLWA